MNKLKYLIVVFILVTLTASVKAISKNNYIESTRLYYKSAYKDIKPSSNVNSWMVPFITKNRFDINTIKIISVFGDHRDSYLKGHIHTAVDIIPAQKNGYAYVYPMANGVVCSIHLGHPHWTIVIKHQLKNGEYIFTSYKHLQEIYVKNGTQVDQNTKIARLYTREESKKYGGSYDHLHLEIRKSFYDYGCASWLTMNKEDLNELFYNPLEFMKNNLGTVK